MVVTGGRITFLLFFDHPKKGGGHEDVICTDYFSFLLLLLAMYKFPCNGGKRLGRMERGFKNLQ